jgi:predicted nucleic acid-binding protein
MNASMLILDTNILIYYLNNQGGETFFARFADTLRAGAGVSVITRIEVLGWRGHTADSIRESTSLLGLCVEYPLSEPVISECIRLRQTFGIKLPDAVIAATGLVEELPLMTRNLSDFQRIPSLKLLNPFAT